MTRSAGIGDRFQQDTWYCRDREPAGAHDRPRRPALYKSYPRAPIIELDRPTTSGGAPLWETMGARRSGRDYSDQALTTAELSQMLWSAQGITATSGGHGLRVAPSAGALYPIETYLVVNAVEDLAPGVYHYGVEQHQLEQINPGDHRTELARAALGQKIAGRAGVVFVWSAMFDRCKAKYAQRAYRYIYLDAGHIGQNLALAAEALGLGSCAIAAFFDQEFNAIIGLDGETESVIYLTTVGKKGRAAK